MTLYVLDTDIAGFAFQRHPTVLQRLQRLPEEDLVVTTIITFGEDLGGWLPACRRALTVWLARVRMLVCNGALISISNGFACRLTRPLPRSSISCARRSSVSAPMISPSPRSHL
jgi:hypothetical protein